MKTQVAAPVRVLLADDHPSVLESIARCLVPEFDVVGRVTDGRALVERAMANGACGYVLKHRAASQLPEAIAAVANGERYLSPSLRDGSPGAT